MSWPTKKYQLELRMVITEVDERGYPMNNNGRFEMADSVAIGAMGFRDMLALMSRIHDVFQALPDQAPAT